MRAGSISSFSTLQIFQEASHIWGLLCQPVYLLDRCPSLWHVQGSTPTGVLEAGCGPSTHSSLCFPFHFFGGMCGLTVTSWGNPAEGMGDCFHLHCQAGGWDHIGCAVCTALERCGSARETTCPEWVPRFSLGVGLLCLAWIHSCGLQLPHRRRVYIIGTGRGNGQLRV